MQRRYRRGRVTEGSAIALICRRLSDKCPCRDERTPRGEGQERMLDARTKSSKNQTITSEIRRTARHLSSEFVKSNIPVTSTF